MQTVQSSPITPPPPRYAGRNALVVGASGGIGRAIASELLDGGADVAVTYRSRRDGLTPLEQKAEALGRRCLPFALDLTDREGINSTCETIIETLGVPHIVVTSAGVLRDRPLIKMSFEDWQTVLDTNLTGNFSLLRALTPAMVRAGKGGRIVNIASVAGLHGQPGQANYGASKGGLITLTRVLARELGPFHITVNAIAPGYVETDMTRHLPDAVRRRYLQRIPLRRFAEPEDIVSTARLLMADDGAYVSGQCLVVDGGLTA
ncbi:MAG: 3-oxoacyl-ACP reductase FabG [Acidobacteriota bacterium]